MREEYRKELEELKIKMELAEEFAKQLPIFEKEIISNKLNSSFKGKIAEKYKTMRLNWGIERRFYDTAENITNFRNETEIINRYLLSIYINTLNLYASHDKYSLKEAMKDSYFYFDELNTTFYFEESQIEKGLELLHNWYLEAKEKAIKDKIEHEKAELLKKLDILNTKSNLK